MARSFFSVLVSVLIGRSFGTTYLQFDENICTSIQGKASGASDDAQSSVGCPDGFTLVSCGFIPEDRNTHLNDGAFIKDNKCFVQTGRDKHPLIPIARCCSSKYFNDCYDIGEGDWSCDRDDCTVSQTCEIGFELTGCTASTYWANIDAAYPSTLNAQTCFAQRSVANAGNKKGVSARARCCKVSGECYTAVASQISGKEVGSISSVTCPALNEFMVACNGRGYHDSLGGYHVIDEDPNVGRERCETINSRKVDNANDGVTAYARCCLLEADDNGAKSNKLNNIMSNNNENKITNIIGNNWIWLIGFFVFGCLIISIVSIVNAVLSCRLNKNKAQHYAAVSGDMQDETAESKRLNM